MLNQRHLHPSPSMSFRTTQLISLPGQKLLLIHPHDRPAIHNRPLHPLHRSTPLRNNGTLHAAHLRQIRFPLAREPLLQSLPLRPALPPLFPLSLVSIQTATFFATNSTHPFINSPSLLLPDSAAKEPGREFQPRLYSPYQVLLESQYLSMSSRSPSTR